MASCHSSAGWAAKLASPVIFSLLAAKLCCNLLLPVTHSFRGLRVSACFFFFFPKYSDKFHKDQKKESSFVVMKSCIRLMRRQDCVAQDVIDVKDIVILIYEDTNVITIIYSI